MFVYFLKIFEPLKHKPAWVLIAEHKYLDTFYRANIYMLKVNSKTTRLLPVNMYLFKVNIYLFNVSINHVIDDILVSLWLTLNIFRIF